MIWELTLDVLHAVFVVLTSVIPRFFWQGRPRPSWSLLHTIQTAFMKQFLYNMTLRPGMYRKLSSGSRYSRAKTDRIVDIAAVQIPRRKVVILDNSGQPFNDSDDEMIPGEWIAPHQCTSSLKTMVWLHGGAFIMGSARQDRPLTIQFAKNGIRVLALDYRLAPEHLFPKGLSDCIAAWLWLKDQGIHAVIGGASAGAGLAIAASIWLREHGHAVSVAAMSPSLDFTSVGPSRWLLQDLDYLPWRWIPQDKRRLAFYLPDDDLAMHPLVSPIWAKPGKVDVLIQVGDAERLKDDGILYSILNHGSIQLEIYTDQTHVWQALSPKFKSAKVAMKRIMDWIHGHDDGLFVYKVSPEGVVKSISPLQVKDTLTAEYQLLQKDTVLQKEANRNVDWTLVHQFLSKIPLNVQ